MNRPPHNDRGPFFSLILATVGRTREVGQLLETLVRQTERDFELIVVDQNPDDRLVPVLDRAREAGIDVRRLRAPRRGLAFARNLGIDVARGQFLAFPDDDCWYDLDVLEQVRRAVPGGNEFDGVVARWVEEDPQALRPEQMLSFRAWHRMRGGDASSICLFLRRELVERIGRFDARLGVGRWYGAGEETDLVIRALSVGASIAFRPSVAVHHRLSAPPRRLDVAAYSEARRRARGTGALYVKHRMSAWVVVRGLASPIVKGIFSRRPHVALARGASVSVGRFEGLMRWRREES
jgi:glycosyltransferase involved in cell wall biosynthesis